MTHRAFRDHIIPCCVIPESDYRRYFRTEDIYHANKHARQFVWQQYHLRLLLFGNDVAHQPALLTHSSRVDIGKWTQIWSNLRLCFIAL